MRDYLKKEIDECTEELYEMLLSYINEDDEEEVYSKVSGKMEDLLSELDYRIDNLEYDHEDEIENLENKINSLEMDVKGLEDEIEHLERELDSK